MTDPTHRDPRSIVTPDAFILSDHLLGYPLATPAKRFVAILIDLAVIGFVTLLTKSFALVLGLVAAIFFVRAGFKRTKVSGSVFDRAMRLSVGCLGVFIAIVTASLWAVFGLDFGDRQQSNDPTDGEAGASAPSLGQSLFERALEQSGSAVSGAALADAPDLAGFLSTAEALVEVGTAANLDSAAMREILHAGVPEGREWAAEAHERIDDLTFSGGSSSSGSSVGATGAGGNPDVAASEGVGRGVASRVRAEISAYSAPEALEEFAAMLAAGVDPDEGPEDAFRFLVLRERVLLEVARDTLGTLDARVSGLERDLSGSRREAAQAQMDLEAATQGGLFATLRGFVDELGFGFGWASLYLTVFLSWWNGQTIGKRLVGIRVVRLDGEPITWWIAFERAGGYAAGFATGLLGFAQVYWDANRQAIHDRIVGTVVVVDGADRVTDWESAL